MENFRGCCCLLHTKGRGGSTKLEEGRRELVFCAGRGKRAERIRGKVEGGGGYASFLRTGGGKRSKECLLDEAGTGIVFVSLKGHKMSRKTGS